MQGKLLENLNIGSLIVPVDLSGGANTGDWINVKNYDDFAIVVFKGAGTAGDDPTLTVLQATAAGGTGSQALNFTKVYTKQGTLTSVGQWTEVTQAAGNTYTDATSAEVQAIWAVQFKTSELDVADGYDFVSCSIADVGTNAQVGCAFIILGNPRYAEVPDDQPSIIA